MFRKAFAADVANGQLRFKESLADLEGQRVLVTVQSCPSENGTDVRLPLEPNIQALDGLDIEQDVSFRMPFRWEVVTALVTDAGPLRPCLILPDELTNE